MVVGSYEMKTLGPKHQVTCFSPAMKLHCLGYYSLVLFFFFFTKSSCMIEESRYCAVGVGVCCSNTGC